MSQDVVIKILQEWADALAIKGFVSDAIRSIGWVLIHGLSWLCDNCYDAVVQIYTLLGFSNSELMQNYINKIHPLVVILLTISIALFGYFLVVKRASTQVGSSLQTFVLIILIVVALPAVSGKMSDIAIAGSNYARAQYIESSSPSFTIITGNLTDLLYVDGLTKDDSFSSYNQVVNNGKPGRNNLKSKTLSYVDINDYMDYDDGDLIHSDVWETKIAMDTNGTVISKDMDNGFWDLFPDNYYRYKLNWWQIIFSLLAMSIALLFTAFKAARIIWEIGAHQIIGPFIAVSDMASGQRIKEFLRSLVSLFGTIFLISALLGLYFIGIQFINSISTINAFAKIVAQIALAWAIIDGPNVVERILGVDAGLKSGYQMVVAGFAATRGVKAAAGTGKSAISKALRTARSTGKVAASALIGKKGINDVKAQTDACKETMSEKATGGYGAVGALKKMTSKDKGDRADGGSVLSKQSHSTNIDRSNGSSLINKGSGSSAINRNTTKPTTLHSDRARTQPKLSKDKSKTTFNKKKK